MNYVLITGASSGIGETFARHFAARGRNLVLVARSADKLQALARELAEHHSIRAEVVPADLTRADGPEQVFESCRRGGLEIETLVNNAGFGLFGSLVKQDPRRIEEMISLNVISLTKLCRLFLPSMLEKRRGGIINVASTAAFQPLPHLACYAATKSFVLSLSEALHVEAASHGVKVCVLCPGPTETRFFEQAAKLGGKGGLRMRNLDPDEVVQVALTAFESGKRVAVPGFFNKLSGFFAPIMPRGLVFKLTSFLIHE